MANQHDRRIVKDMLQRSVAELLHNRVGADSLLPSLCGCFSPFPRPVVMWCLPWPLRPSVSLERTPPSGFASSASRGGAVQLVLRYTERVAEVMSTRNT